MKGKDLIDVPSKTKMKLAYLIRRAGAYFIDCIIAFSISMLFIQWMILSQVRTFVGIDDQWFQDSINMELYVLLTISLPVWLYFSIMESSGRKATYGKSLMKLVVIKSEGDEKISFTQSFPRTILKLLPWEMAHLGIIFPSPLYYSDTPNIRILTIIGIVLFFIYFLSIVWDRQSQSLYDKLIKTEVQVR